ncbi:MAG: hypothetical protein CMF45_06985 [Legionellales bacterium]|nr:hypothetical protein [Legionellales bacterium]
MNSRLSTPDQSLESDIVRVLEHRYGDGLIYLPQHQPEGLFKIAKSEGFIDSEGYLTRKGRNLIAKYQFTD